MSQSPVDNPMIIAQELGDHGPFPNHPRWPLLVYQKAWEFESQIDPGVIEQNLQSHGWTGCWRNGIFGFHHYHSNTHEVLFIYGGRATLQFGGEHGPHMEVAAGDLAVLPAGTVHKKITGTSDFCVIGAYPGGVAFDMNYGRPDERPEADRNIQQVSLPDQDPLYGPDGPLFTHWT